MPAGEPRFYIDEMGNKMPLRGIWQQWEEIMTDTQNTDHARLDTVALEAIENTLSRYAVPSVGKKLTAQFMVLHDTAAMLLAECRALTAKLEATSPERMACVVAERDEARALQREYFSACKAADEELHMAELTITGLVNVQHEIQAELAATSPERMACVVAERDKARAELEEARIANAALSDKLSKWEAGYYDDLPTVTLNPPTVQAAQTPTAYNSAAIADLQARVAALEGGQLPPVRDVKADNVWHYVYILDLLYSEHTHYEGKGYEVIAKYTKGSSVMCIMRRPRQDASDGEGE